MKELLYLKDDQIKDCIQLLLYAYRETFSDPKDILKKNSMGKLAHLCCRRARRPCLRARKTPLTAHMRFLDSPLASMRIRDCFFEKLSKIIPESGAARGNALGNLKKYCGGVSN